MENFQILQAEYVEQMNKAGDKIPCDYFEILWYVNQVVVKQHSSMADIVSGGQRDTHLPSIAVPDPVVDAVGTVFGNVSASAPGLKMLSLYA